MDACFQSLMFLMNTLRSLRYCKELSFPSRCTCSYPFAGSLFPPWKAWSALRNVSILPSPSFALISSLSCPWRCLPGVAWRHCWLSHVCWVRYYWLRFRFRNMRECSLASFVFLLPIRHTHQNLHRSTLIVPHLPRFLRWFTILIPSLFGKFSLWFSLEALFEGFSWSSSPRWLGCRRSFQGEEPLRNHFPLMCPLRSSFWECWRSLSSWSFASFPSPWPCI